MIVCTILLTYFLVDRHELGKSIYPSKLNGKRQVCAFTTVLLTLKKYEKYVLSWLM